MDARGQLPLNDLIEVVPYNPDWPELFRLERERVLNALYPHTTLLVEHIGSTSVPGLAAKPVIDLIASLEHFPPSSEVIEALGALGYAYRGEAGIAGRAFFRTNPRTRHLHVYGLGHAEFERHMRFRSYLRAFPAEAKRYEAVKLRLAEQFRDNREAYTGGKDGIVQDLLENARIWNDAFGPLRWLQSALEGAPFEWLIAGGWAPELHANARVGSSPHRPHEDVDVIVYRDDAPSLYAFLNARGWRLERIVQSRYLPWHGEPLGDEVIQVHADRPDNAAGYLDFLLTPGDAHLWRFRRDPTITRARGAAHRMGVHGLPYLAPELVLLFKSRPSRGEPRGKDALDAERTLPLLESEPRAWLRSVLERLHERHPWLEQLK